MSKVKNTAKGKRLIQYLRSQSDVQQKLKAIRAASHISTGTT